MTYHPYHIPFLLLIQIARFRSDLSTLKEIESILESEKIEKDDGFHARLAAEVLKRSEVSQDSTSHDDTKEVHKPDGSVKVAVVTA